MSHAISDESLGTIFLGARTHRYWLDKPVSSALMTAIYDLMRWAPTSGNTNPGRILFVVSKAAKERLKPHLDSGNVRQTMSAPATAILAYDLEFTRYLPKLNPPAVGWFGNPEDVRVTAFRNGSLQGAYFIVAARALGLDCGPMSGFSNEGVDQAFFAGTGWRSNFLCNIGYGDPERLRPRAARLSFDEACRIA